MHRPVHVVCCHLSKEETKVLDRCCGSANYRPGPTSTPFSFFLSFFPALWAKNGFYSLKGLFKKQKRIYSRDLCASLILRCLLPGPLHKRADLWWYMLTYAHLYVEWLWEDTQNTVAAVAGVGGGGVHLTFILYLPVQFKFLHYVACTTYS